MGNLHLINKRRRHQERVFPAWPQLWGSRLTTVIPVCYKAGQGLVVLSKQTVRVTASESAQSSALSVRMEQILLLLHYSMIFILEAFSLDFIGRCFSQAWSILGTKRGNPQLVCFSSEKCLFFKGSCLLFHNYLLLFFFFFLVSCFSYVFLDGLQRDVFQVQ